MKKYMVLDTETTGLEPGQICQLSYLIFDENFEIEKIYNRFYNVEYVEEGASNIHGFTKEKLDILSEGKEFDFDISEICFDFIDVEKIIIHNKEFDLKFLDFEFKRFNTEIDLRSKSFCTMNYHTDILKLPGKSRNGSGYKWPRLSETLKYYGICDEHVLEISQKYFSCDEIGFHDARFDVTGLYLICKRMKINKETV